MGKIRGTPGMRSHISVHRATTKYFSNSFVFKTEMEKEGLPRASTPDLGAGGPRFKSRRPDQNILRIFLGIPKFLFTHFFTVEFCQTGGPDAQVIKFPRLRCTLRLAKKYIGRSAIQKVLNRGKLGARHLASMGKIMEILCIPRVIDIRKCKSDVHA
jgi:hypothetical protein